MAANSPKTPKNYEAVAAKAPSQLHKDFAEWIYVQTGVRPDLKTVQIVCSLRMDFQASPENQKALAEKRAKAAELKKASAERKRAKLEKMLAEIKGEPVAEEEKIEAPVEPGPVQKLTVLYGNGEPEVHKFGCNDLKKFTRAKGFTKDTVQVRSHTELTEDIYADQIGGGEATVKDCYMGYDTKPCCPALDD